MAIDPAFQNQFTREKISKFSESDLNRASRLARQREPMLANEDVAGLQQNIAAAGDLAVSTAFLDEEIQKRRQKQNETRERILGGSRTQTRFASLKPTSGGSQPGAAASTLLGG